jgi:hypothetical protein
MESSGSSTIHTLRVDVRWDQPLSGRFYTYTPCGLRIDNGTSHISFTIDPAPGGYYPNLGLLLNAAGWPIRPTVIFELFYDNQLVYRDSTVYGQFSSGWPGIAYRTPHFDGFHFSLPHDPVFYESGTMGEVTGHNQCGSTTSWTPSTDNVRLSIVSGNDYVQFWHIVDDFLGPRIPMGSSITVLASELQHYLLAADGSLPDSQGVWVGVRAESNGIAQVDSLLVVPYFLKFVFDPDSIQSGEESRVVVKTVDAQGEDYFRPVGPLVTVGIKDSTEYGTLSYNGSGLVQADEIEGVETSFISDEYSGTVLKFLANEKTPTQTFPVTLFAKKTDEGSSSFEVPPNMYPFPGRDTVRAVGSIKFIAGADSLHHFEVRLDQDTIAFTETTKIFVQAKDSSNQDIEFEGTNLLTFSIDSTVYGSFIDAAGDTISPPLADVLYSDAKNGIIRFAAVNKNPDSVVSFKIIVKLQEDTTKTGDTTLVLWEQTLKIVMSEPREVRPSIPSENQNAAMVQQRRKTFEVQMTRARKSVADHPFLIRTDYVRGSGGHDHDNTRGTVREDNNDNYGYFSAGTSPTQRRPLENLTGGNGRFSANYHASIWGDTMRVHLESRDNRLLKDSVSVVERVAELELLPESPNYTPIGGTCAHHGPSDRGIPEGCQTPNSNHWATAAVNENIEAIAAEYGRLFPRLPRLDINDMSLPFGGRFDINGRWVGDHTYHRNGLDVDVRTSTMTGDLYSDVNRNGAFDPGVDVLIVDRNNNGRFDRGSLIEFRSIAAANGVMRMDLEDPEGQNEHWHLYFWNVR